MTIEWITVKNYEDVREAEDLFCVRDGEFGAPIDYPATGFLYADFSENQCIEWLTIGDLQTKIKNLESELDDVEF